MTIMRDNRYEEGGISPFPSLTPDKMLGFVQTVRRLEGQTGVHNAWALVAAVASYVGAYHLRPEVLRSFSVDEIAALTEYRVRITEVLPTGQTMVHVSGRTYSFTLEEVGKVLRGPLPPHFTINLN